MLSDLIFFTVSFKACVSLFIFILDDVSIGESGVLKSPTMIVLLSISPFSSFPFFFNDTATTEIYTGEDTLSLHDALPILFREHLRRMCNLLFLDGMSYKYQLNLPGLLCHLKLVFPFLFSVWMMCPLVKVGC